jgi:hypothetical protein
MTLSRLADQTQPAEVAHMDETNTDPSEKPSTPLTFAEAMRQMNWGAESEISPEDSKKTIPLTFAEAARQRNWGAGDQAMKPDPNTDRYFISTTGTTDPKWEPSEEDWKRLAELSRG